MILAGWCYVFKDSKASVTPETLQRLFFTPCLRGHSIPVAPMLSVILELPIRRYQLRTRPMATYHLWSPLSDDNDNRSPLISASVYDNDNRSPLIYAYSCAVQSSPACITCQTPSTLDSYGLWWISLRAIPTINAVITVVTTNQHVQFMRLRGSCSYHRSYACRSNRA